MKIYVAHSREFDYKNELYIPIRENVELRKYNIILPHEEEGVSSNTRDFYNKIDIIIAECSYPATGLGIELGFAYDDNTPIYCIYKQGKKVSGSIRAVTNDIYEYANVDEMLNIIKKIIENNKK